jgi:hypothetical protein
MGVVHGGIIVDTLPLVLDHSWFPLRIHMGGIGFSHSMLGGMWNGIGIGFVIIL